MSSQNDISHLLTGLNPAQREAVIHGENPLLIIAGAGTGKTKVITQRIAHLIASKQASPEQILAVTFTEKAANEMEERVDQLIPYSYSFVEISTFNSFGERVLRNYGMELGYPLDFKLLDDVEQAIFFRENLFRFPLDYYRPLSFPTRHVQELLDAVKRMKQEDIRPEEYLEYSSRLGVGEADEAEKEWARKHAEIARVYSAYQELLKKEGKIDFEDQVLLVVELFRTRPSILREFQDKYRYILVDEFQDTNYIQFELLKLLAARHRNLTVVGDDDQSIFRFRGASLSNILNFKRVYPEAKKIVLTENYRSTQAILDSAHRLIQHNNPYRLEVQEKVDKILKATVEDRGRSIHMLQTDTLSHEADKVADIIQEKAREGIRYGEMAVLVRRNADADIFLRTLNMKQIPFRFSGSRGLYSQEEVKVLISFIKALTDFEDSRSLFHLALSEVYRINLYDLTVVSNYSQKRNLPLHKVFRLIQEGQSPVEISPDAEAACKRVFEDLLHFSSMASTRNAGMVLYEFLQRTEYLKSLIAERNLQAELKIKNIRLFFDKVKNFSELTNEDSIHSFAKHLNLLQDVGDNPSTAEAELEEDAVSVLTVHKAKGLEFKVVFMVSLISDRFPGRERREKIPFPDDLLKEKLPDGENYLQEERRLFYVGMTRAKRFLYLTWARDYGLKRLKKVSPFVLEALDIPKVPEEVMRRSAQEELERYGQDVRHPEILGSPRIKDILTLSYFQVEDYITCPLKYRFRHVLKIPVLPHHNLVFGRVLHNTIHFYLQKKMAGQRIAVEGFFEEYNRGWINAGYLSREHEEMRRQAGRKALELFYAREESSGCVPAFLEKRFKWQQERIRFIGRWDRIDFRPEGAVIVDFKATEIKGQKEADRRASESLQMDLYALSFLKTQKSEPAATELYFLESDIIGRARKGENELKRAMEKILETEEGIRTQEFGARPDWHNCSYCEFKTICPSTYAY
ncbi:MAG: ATP-dependent DNA helicase [Candidatus Aminicenantales bacterium]